MSPAIDSHCENLMRTLDTDPLGFAIAALDHIARLHAQIHDQQHRLDLQQDVINALMKLAYPDEIAGGDA